METPALSPLPAPHPTRATRPSTCPPTPGFPQGPGDSGTPLTGPLCIRVISVGWYTLVSSCPLYPLYGDTGLLAGRKQERCERRLSAPFPNRGQEERWGLGFPGATSNPGGSRAGGSQLGGEAVGAPEEPTPLWLHWEP